jgi:uncharacterized membrane-anchored protein YjiN (DUF445 family)
MGLSVASRSGSSPPDHPADETRVTAGMTGAPAPLTAYDEAVKQAQLDRMKRWATGLLALSTVIFLVARVLESRYPWVGIIRATAEASMVGGLADWFAVTALFRHPLGIPIPHTAIIPARKDRVGASLGGFVQRNFLNRDVIAFRLRGLRAAERIARWISVPENTRLIARHAATSLAAAAQVLRDEDVQALIDRTLASRVRGTRVAPLLGRVLSVITAGNRHQDLLNEAIRLTARAVSENRDLIREKIEAETPWWIPGVVDDKIYQKVVNSIDRTLTEIRDNPSHPLRERFDEALMQFIEKLHNSPEVIDRAEQIKEEILDADVVRKFSSSVWNDAKAALIRYAESAESRPPGSIERGLTAFGEAMLTDPELLAKVDQWIADAVLFVVERYQHEVGQLIAQTVASWDPTATSRRIELAIGRDLQFIRINGTLVGGLAGMVIYVVSRFF